MTMSKKLTILVKFPTRQRPYQFYQVLSRYIQLCSDKANTKFLITYDSDDLTMSNSAMVKRLMDLNVELNPGQSRGKIHACNRGISLRSKWDILVLASDDMICQVNDWDEIIRAKMKELYPNKDGCLWFNDGYTGQKLNTMCILDREYYKRFGYIYHESYRSLWCDNEYTEVAQRLGKITYIDQVLFRHEHFSNNRQVASDELYKKNEALYYIDQQNYNLRKQQNFNLSQ